ncbi:MAG TPA: hypothetical protein VKG44_08820, partial [Candidatus Baltobacteraceae bacterium]|nr:hypothetical protein [Candidatus Baltobacteraceae bacterium]
VDDFSSPLAHGSDEELFLYLQAHPPSDASKVVVNTPFSPPEKGPHRMALALPLQVLTLRKDGQVVKAKKYVCWTDLGGLVRGDLSLP